MHHLAILLAVGVAMAAAGCRGHPKRVHWGEDCALRVQETVDGVSVGLITRGELYTCVDPVPEGVAYSTPAFDSQQRPAHE